MNEISSSRRWYDQDPAVSIAVSIIKNANHKNQVLVSEFISEKAKIHNIEVSPVPENKFNLFFRRWYDSDDKVSKALELLKNAPSEIRKEIALDAIHYLCNLDSAACKDPV